MNPLWLLLIIPVSVFFGFFSAALCASSSDRDDFEDDK